LTRRVEKSQCFFVLLTFFLFAATSYGQAKLPRIPLYVKDKTIHVEVARTEEEQARGLMGRRSLGKDEGMLFVYERDVYHGFWMKNTLIPLSIAFIDKSGRILAILDMEPLTLDIHMPPRAFRYALEMNKGWFETHRIQVGDFVRFSK